MKEVWAEGGGDAPLRHPHVVAVLAASLSPRRSLFAMELAGADLATELRHNPRPPDGLAVVLHIAEALAFVHSFEGGRAHGALEPRKCLAFSAQGRRIWKLAMRLGGPHPAARLARPPFYEAPEVLGGKAAPSPASDVWSLGVLLTEVASGKPPYHQLGPKERTAHSLPARVCAGKRSLLPPNARTSVAELVRAMRQDQPAQRAGLSWILTKLRKELPHEKAVAEQAGPLPLEVALAQRGPRLPRFEAAGFSPEAVRRANVKIESVRMERQKSKSNRLALGHSIRGTMMKATARTRKGKNREVTVALVPPPAEVPDLGSLATVAAVVKPFDLSRHAAKLCALGIEEPYELTALDEEDLREISMNDEEVAAFARLSDALNAEALPLGRRLKAHQLEPCAALLAAHGITAAEFPEISLQRLRTIAELTEDLRKRIVVAARLSL